MSAAIDWNLYRSFLAVYREKSLSGAARALGNTQPTVGRHIESLEAHLGQSLFVRSRTGLTPTERALDLVPHAEAIEAASGALLRAASGAEDAPGGTVRLTASAVVGVEILPPILQRFQTSYPDIAVELALSNRSQDLSRREADIAVRMLRPVQSTLVARKIGDVPIRLYAHRDYVAVHGLPERIDRRGGHKLVGPDVDETLLRAIHGLSLRRENFHLRTDNELAQHALVRAGAGIGGMQRPLAERDPALVPVLPDAFELGMEMWLVMHADLRTSRRVRLLFDHLARDLHDYVHGQRRD